MKDIKTWRERIDLPADFPLHAATVVELAMVAEIADLRAEVARLSATGKTLFGLPVVIDDSVPPGQARFTSGRRTFVADIGSQVHPDSALPSRTLDDHQQDCTQVAALGREALMAATNPQQRMADLMAKMGDPPPDGYVDQDHK